MPAAGAEYHEWGLEHGCLKRTQIGNEIIFNLEFSLEDLHELFALQVRSLVSGFENVCKASRHSSPYRLRQDGPTSSAAE